MKDIVLKAVRVGWPFLFLASLICIAYSQTLHYPFLWDDEAMVVNNPLIKDLGHVDTLFKVSAFGESTSSPTFYRPVQLLSYMFTYHWFGLSPVAYRMGNILLHVLSSWLIYRLFLLFGLSRLALGMAAIFSLHPMHIESITYISGRGDSLYLCFSLLSMLLYFGARLRQGYVAHDPRSEYRGWFKSRIWQHFRYAAAFMTYVVAVLSKENAILVPMIIAVFECMSWLYRRRAPETSQSTLVLPPQTVTSLGTLFLMMVGSVWYAMTRLASVNAGQFGLLSPMAEASGFERVLTLCYAFPTYVRIFFFPFQLHMEYMTVIRALSSIYVWFWFPLVVAGLTGLAWIAGIGKASRRPFILFGIFWFLLGLAPTLSLATPMASTVREHWLTFPSIGLFLIGGLWFIRPDRCNRFFMNIR